MTMPLKAARLCAQHDCNVIHMEDECPLCGSKEHIKLKDILKFSEVAVSLLRANESSGLHFVKA